MTSFSNLLRTTVAAILGVLSMGAPAISLAQEKPAPNVQPAPTTVPGRPDIPNAEVAKTLRGVPQPHRDETPGELFPFSGSATDPGLESPGKCLKSLPNHPLGGW